MRGGRDLLPAMLAAVIVVGACAGDDSPAPSVGGGSDPAPATAPEDRSVATVSSSTAPADAGDAVRPEGFARVQATVTLADGTRCELCLWLADDADRRARGLMHVTDLGDADGMAFVFEGPTTSRFWMGNTPMPLSIAFFASDGTFVSTSDMEPCLHGGGDCPRYHAEGEYLTAIELPLGAVADLDIGVGSVLSLSDLPCA